MNKREILSRLVEKGVWERLSPEEVRLYLLFIIAMDNRQGEGLIRIQQIRNYLQINEEELKKVLDNLQKNNLIKVQYRDEQNIKFQVLSAVDKRTDKVN